MDFGKRTWGSVGEVSSVFSKLMRLVIDAARDVLPIVFVIAFFQVVILRQPFPDLGDVLLGGMLVVVGLALFVRGLDMGLFPLGETMAHAFAKKGSVTWLIVFAFALGFGTTVAEPALTAVAAEAARTLAEAGTLPKNQAAMNAYAFGLRLSVGLSVGFAIAVGVLRIIKGWPVQWVIVAGYTAVVVLTFFSPPEIVGIAYDSGGVTTSTITVPLVTALGVGLASSIRGRNPVTDGFGLIAFASLTPMIFVMLYGLIY